jgi:hypothetical protein
VKNKKKHSQKNRSNQGRAADSSQPNKINTSTPFDFSGKNLTAYGGLLPVATLLEKIGFRALLNTMPYTNANDSDKQPPFMRA